MNTIMVINICFLLLFGITLSLSFADISFKYHKTHYFFLYSIFITISILAFIKLGDLFLLNAYPILVHLPLFLVIKYCYKKPFFIAAISVLSSYLFCIPIRWFGALISIFFQQRQEVSYLAQIFITIPFMFLIIKYISSYVIRLKYEEKNVLMFFISIPLIYYILAYSLTIYTNLLCTNVTFILEFMYAITIITYFLFSIFYLKLLYEKKDLDVERAVFKIITEQSASEIETLRKYQNQAAIYRHDLRHHLTYISSCILNKEDDSALKYIDNIYNITSSCDSSHYCENESVNLIISSHIGKAQSKNINIKVDVTICDFERFAISDLCSLLSNGLENATNICEKMQNRDDSFVQLRIYEKNQKICILIKNSYDIPPVFVNDLPISREKNHGIGVKSMVYVVEKYKGIYQFSAKDGVFIFRTIL